MRELREYEPLLKALNASICEKTEIHSEIPLEQIMKQPRLVVAFNHATALSWIPAIALLTEKIVEAGGGDRIPLGVVDKFFYSNPITQGIAEYITQSKFPLGFDELLASFQKRDRTDLVIFPEGAQTFFGDPDKIQDFRSPRFLELAIRAQAPILLAVHRGSEAWNMPLQLPQEWGAWLLPFSAFFGKGLMQSGLLNVPFRLKKIPLFSMKLHLYSPALYESDLSENENERRHQLQEEAEKVKALMQEMWEELPG